MKWAVINKMSTSKKIVVAFSGINPSEDVKKVRLFHVKRKKDPSYLHLNFLHILSSRILHYFAVHPKTWWRLYHLFRWGEKIEHYYPSCCEQGCSAPLSH